MKPGKKKYDSRDQLPGVIFNWLLLLWFLLLMLMEAIKDIVPQIFYAFLLLFYITSVAVFALLCYKGTRLRFWFNPRTDSNGWLIKTGKSIKRAMKNLVVTYPRLVKRVRLKDSEYRVTVTKKYRYHPNPIEIEEID